MRQLTIMIGSLVALVVIFLSLIFLGNILAQKLGVQQTGQWYNCQLAEISPDFPLEVKEQCRKARAQK